MTDLEAEARMCPCEDPSWECDCAFVASLAEADRDLANGDTLTPQQLREELGLD